MTNRFRIRTAAGIVAAALALVIDPPAARGFYFAGWPGAGLPAPLTLIPPGAPPEGNPPGEWFAAEKPPDHLAEPVRPPSGGPGEVGPVVALVPEPATLALAAVGLGVLAARRLRRAGR
jgi:hypothetical protein